MSMAVDRNLLLRSPQGASTAQLTGADGEARNRAVRARGVVKEKRRLMHSKVLAAARALEAARMALAALDQCNPPEDVTDDEDEDEREDRLTAAAAAAAAAASAASAAVAAAARAVPATLALAGSAPLALAITV